MPSPDPKTQNTSDVLDSSKNEEQAEQLLAPPGKPKFTAETWMRYALRCFIGLLVFLGIVFAIVVSYHEAKRKEVYNNTANNLENAIFQQLTNQDELKFNFVSVNLVSAFDTIAQLRTSSVSPKNRTQEIIAEYDGFIERIEKLKFTDGDKLNAVKIKQIYRSLLQANQARYREKKQDEIKSLQAVLNLLDTVGHENIEKEKSYFNPSDERVQLKFSCTLRLAVLLPDKKKGLSLLNALNSQFDYKTLETLAKTKIQKPHSLQQQYALAIHESIQAKVAELQGNKKNRRTAIRNYIKFQSQIYDDFKKKFAEIKSLDKTSQSLLLQAVAELDQLIDAKLLLAKLNHSDQELKKIDKFYGQQINKMLQMYFAKSDQSTTNQSETIVLNFLKSRSALFQRRELFSFFDWYTRRPSPNSNTQ